MIRYISIKIILHMSFYLISKVASYLTCGLVSHVLWQYIAGCIKWRQLDLLLDKGPNVNTQGWQAARMCNFDKGINTLLNYGATDDQDEEVMNSTSRSPSPILLDYNCATILDD